MREQVFWNSCSALSIAPSVFPTGSYAWSIQDLVLVPKPNRFTIVNNNQQFANSRKWWEKAVERVLVITFLADVLVLIPISFTLNANHQLISKWVISVLFSQDSFPWKIARAAVEKYHKASPRAEDKNKKKRFRSSASSWARSLCTSPSKSTRFSLCIGCVRMLRVLRPFPLGSDAA